MDITMQNTITLTAQSEGKKVIVEIPWDANVNELFEAFYTLTIGLGYHHESWKTAIGDINIELNPEENKQQWDVFE